MTNAMVQITKETVKLFERKKEKKRAGFPFFYHMRFKYEVTNQIETRKMERGIAVKPLVLVTARSMYMMGDELGRANCIDRLLGSPGLSTAMFTWIGNADFWSCHADFTPKKSGAKKCNFEFLGYLGEIKSDLTKNAWTCMYFHCVRVRASNILRPNLQWFTRYDSRKLCPLFCLAELVPGRIREAFLAEHRCSRIC